MVKVNIIAHKRRNICGNIIFIIINLNMYRVMCQVVIEQVYKLRKWLRWKKWVLWNATSNIRCLLAANSLRIIQFGLKEKLSITLGKSIPSFPKYWNKPYEEINILINLPWQVSLNLSAHLIWFTDEIQEVKYAAKEKQLPVK